MDFFSISQRTTPWWSFEEDIVYFSQAGIPGIGLWRRKILEVGEEKAIELLSDASVKPCYVDWAGGFTGTLGWSYREGIEDALRFVQFASKVGARLVIIHSGGHGLHTFNHSRRIFRDALKEIVPAAAEVGVQLALEPCHPADMEQLTFISSMTEAVDFLAGMAEAQVKLVLDLGHVGLNSEDLEKIDRWIGRAAMVQVADLRIIEGRVSRVPLGEGSVPISGILSRLGNGGFHGFVDLELWDPRFQELPANQWLSNLVSVFKTQIAPLLVG
jgi:sugar phosphate isomerase/epimerase